MQGVVAELTEVDKLWIFNQGSICIGHIVQITDDGQAIVDFQGNRIGLVTARSVIEAPFQRDSQSLVGIPVLLVFENGDPTLPIIIGLIRDSLFPPRPAEEMTLPMDRPQDITLDGRKMFIEAKEEIVLHCGRSSVTLKRDGKIIVRGTQILSRASETNKIKGASVRIN